MQLIENHFGLVFIDDKDRVVPFPTAIKRLRKDQDLSQPGLAKLLAVTTGTVCGWEHGSPPKPSMLLLIRRVFFSEGKYAPVEPFVFSVKAIKELRESQGLTIAKFTHLLGVSTQAYERWMDGHSPTKYILLLIQLTFVKK